MEAEAKSRIVAFDILKGIAILLVVIGHWAPEISPIWWRIVNKFIYSFHMPVFMAASGFLYAYTYRPTAYAKFITKKFKRLMIPYFSVSVVIFFIKLLMERFVAVDHPVTLQGFVQIFYFPAAGFFLWFIWALWWIFVIIPWFKTPNQRLALFVASIFLAYLPYHAPEVFCLQQTQAMLVYFVLGTVLHDCHKFLNFFSLRHTIFIVSVFIFLEILYIVHATWLEYLLPYIGIGAMVAISVSIERKRTAVSSILEILGLYSFAIYLFHTTFEGLAKAVLAKFFPMLISPDSGGCFVIGTSIIIGMGTVLPILLYRYIFRRYRVTQLLFGK